MIIYIVTCALLIVYVDLLDDELKEYEDGN